MTSTPSPKAASQGVPDGWKLVPIEPTQTMRVEGHAAYRAEVRENGCLTTNAGAVYRAMLFASPEAPSLDAAVPASGGVEAALDAAFEVGVAKFHEIKKHCLRDETRTKMVLRAALASLSPAQTSGSEAGGELPAIPDDDADFTPDLARKIIAGYQALLLATSASEPAGGVREADHELKRQLAYVAKAHAHHALWIGLPTDSIEAFGRALAFRIYQSILKKTAALSAPASSSPAEEGERNA